MIDKAYWNNRVSKYGHTGYGDSFIYCFDQVARKFAIETLLQKINFNEKTRALDFGCGTGDFIEILKKDFKYVNGVDTSEEVLYIAMEKYKNDKNIIFSEEINKDLEGSGCDFVLTVTVLQSLNKQELGNVLEKISVNMKSGAYALFMEFFKLDNLNKQYNVDAATLGDFKGIIYLNGWEIKGEFPFYNPFLHPTASWQAYNRNVVLKLLKPFKRTKFAKGIFTRKAEELIHNKKDVFGPVNNIFKIYLLQKIR